MILLSGATGKIGRHLVSQLRREGAAIRAVARDPDNAGLPDDVEVVRADLSDPRSLEDHLDDVEVVFLLWPTGGVNSAAVAVNVLARHVRRIVYLSSAGVRDGAERQADPINQSHAELEQLVEASGLERTFIRASGFASNTLGWAEEIRDTGVVRWPYGQASRSLIHEHDIAAVAARALTEDGHSGATYVVTGPQALTQAEQVHAIGAAIGRPVRWEELSREDARRQLIVAFGDESTADGALDAWTAFVSRPELVTSTVEDVTGTPARTFGQWAKEHADDFR